MFKTLSFGFLLKMQQITQTVSFLHFAHSIFNIKFLFLSFLLLSLFQSLKDLAFYSCLQNLFWDSAEQNTFFHLIVILIFK